MKIIYMIQSIANSGGTERVLANKVNYLADLLGYDITIVTTDQRNRKPFFAFSEKVAHIDLAINYHDIRKYSPLLRLWYFGIKLRLHKKKLAGLLKSMRPDIAISMYGSEIFILPFIKDKSKKVLELHFSKRIRVLHERSLNRGYIMQVMSFIRDFLEQKIVNRYDKFIVLTQEDKEAWGNKKNIDVVYNACPLRSSQKSEVIAHSAIAVGRLSSQKGFDMLVSVWQRVVIKYPTWVLNIFGSGEDREMLIQLIEDKKLTNHIHILSPVTNIQEEYLKASIFIFSSRYEGFGLVLIEAMACGLPAVSFACPCGPKDIITDGVDGYLVPVGDIDGMTERICMLIEDEKLRKSVGDKAYLHSERFSQEIIMKQWEALFNVLINKN